MHDHDTSTTGELSPLRNGLLSVMVIAAGLTVANNYYNQSMLGLLAGEFHLSAVAVSALPTLTQLGNVVGILFVAPLGDRLERRFLTLITMAGLIAALVAAALAPNFVWLAGSGLFIGLFATVTQQIVPFAVHLAPPKEQGRVLGIVTGGILAGILLARTISGSISDLWSWRAVFWTAAGLMTATAGAMFYYLPRSQPVTDLSYRELLGSLWRLVRTHRTLRWAVMVQALLFAAFIGFWSNLAFVLDRPPYHLGATAVGLMALVGIAGALAASFAGRLADRQGSGTIVSYAAACVVVVFVILILCRNSLAVIIGGVLFLDLAVQSSQVANQAQIYALDHSAASRLNTIFMATMVLGGAVGAALSGLAYSALGWSGTCLFGAGSAATALCLSLIKGRGDRFAQHQ